MYVYYTSLYFFIFRNRSSVVEDVNVLVKMHVDSDSWRLTAVNLKTNENIVRNISWNEHDSFMYLGKFSIVTGFKNKGYGSSLTNLLKCLCKKQKLKGILLTTSDEEAKNFFAKQGFKPHPSDSTLNWCLDEDFIPEPKYEQVNICICCYILIICDFLLVGCMH